MNDRDRCLFGFRRKFVAEDLGQQTMNDGMQPFLGEAVTVLLCFPDINVAQPTLGTLDGEMRDEAGRFFGTQGLRDPRIERRVYWHILGE